jgi:mono/diheme cytochrome c family protein
MPLSHAEIEFVRDVKPILEHNCVSCHREGNAKGKVRLDTKKAAFAGDDVIVPGKPDDSSLYWTTTLPSDDELVMPPFKHEDKDYPLRDQEKEILKKWILAGANWPDEEVLVPLKRLPKTVTFVDNIQPILEQNCVACHYDGKVKGELKARIVSSMPLLPIMLLFPASLWGVIFGYYALYRKTTRCLCLPEGNDPLSSTDLFLLRRWIEEGADWPESAQLSPKKKSFTVLGNYAQRSI